MGDSSGFRRGCPNSGITILVVSNLTLGRTLGFTGCRGGGAFLLAPGGRSASLPADRFFSWKAETDGDPGGEAIVEGGEEGGENVGGGDEGGAKDWLPLRGDTTTAAGEGSAVSSMGALPLPVVVMSSVVVGFVVVVGGEDGGIVVLSRSVR